METLLNCLAHDHFVSLVNHRSHWTVKYRGADEVSEVEIESKSLDRLLESLGDILDGIDEAKATGDE